MINFQFEDENSQTNDFFVQLCILLMKCVLGYYYSKRISNKTIKLLNNILNIPVVNSFMINEEMLKGLLVIFVEQFQNFNK